MKKFAPLALAVAVLATGPAQADGTKELLGTMLGGAIGGFAGSNVGKGSGRLAATAGGAVLGAMIGHGAGASMDRADNLYPRNYGAAPYGRYPSPRVVYVDPPAYYRPAPMYVERYVAAPRYRESRVRWRDYEPERYRPGRDIDYTQPQEHCREYQSNVSGGGLPQPAYGIACLQPDGTWKIIR